MERKAFLFFRKQGIQKYLYTLENLQSHAHTHSILYVQKRPERFSFPHPTSSLLLVAPGIQEDLFQNTTWTEAKGLELSETTYDKEYRPCFNSLEKSLNKQLQLTANNNNKTLKKRKIDYQGYHVIKVKMSNFKQKMYKACKERGSMVHSQKKLIESSLRTKGTKLTR